MTSAALPANPFPGMNPYLENARLWPDAHTSIIIGLRDFLAPRLQPNYGVRVEQRVYVARGSDADNGLPQVRIPDAIVLTAAAAGSQRGSAVVAEPKPGAAAVAVALPATELARQRYLQVLRADNLEVVAVIKVLSPSNKSGADRKDYLDKRAEVQSSTAHLVEIDLLRAGAPMPVVGDAPEGRYRILVANGRLRPRADLYAFGLQEAIPEFALPLGAGAGGVSVNLNEVLSHVYAHGSYNMFIDYGRDPEPPLSDDDRVWVDELLRRQGLRKGGS